MAKRQPYGRIREKSMVGTMMPQLLYVDSLPTPTETRPNRMVEDQREYFKEMPSKSASASNNTKLSLEEEEAASSTWLALVGKEWF
jgi:hypothetical protein